MITETTDCIEQWKPQKNEPSFRRSDNRDNLITCATNAVNHKRQCFEQCINKPNIVYEIIKRYPFNEYSM